MQHLIDVIGILMGEQAACGIIENAKVHALAGRGVFYRNAEEQKDQTAQKNQHQSIATRLDCRVFI
jgi:hypothetical protein